MRVEHVTIPENVLEDAAAAIVKQLGHKGVDKVGGEKWWQWRQGSGTYRKETENGTEKTDRGRGDEEEGKGKLKGEWIEMRRDYVKRKQQEKGGDRRSTRVMLYVHGGAYFFGSVDEHRYQLQRHARKLEARVFAR